MLFTILLAYSCVSYKSKELENEINNNETPPSASWNIDYYIDNYREKTDEAFITNQDYILGIFSNSATSNSKLHVKFLISSDKDLAIKLYEYGGSNPVKSFREEKYKFEYKGSDNQEKSFYPKLSQDRLIFNTSDSSEILKDFYSSGEVKFFITHEEHPNQTYSFKVDFNESYLKAYNQLIKSDQPKGN